MRPLYSRSPQCLHQLHNMGHQSSLQFCCKCNMQGFQYTDCTQARTLLEHARVGVEKLSGGQVISVHLCITPHCYSISQMCKVTSQVISCCAVLCCAVLCCAVLCCAVLCCAVLCCAVLCCAVLCCAVLQHAICLGSAEQHNICAQ